MAHSGPVGTLSSSLIREQNSVPLATRSVEHGLAVSSVATGTLPGVDTRHFTECGRRKRRRSAFRLPPAIINAELIRASACLEAASATLSEGRAEQLCEHLEAAATVLENLMIAAASFAAKEKKPKPQAMAMAA